VSDPQALAAGLGSAAAWAVPLRCRTRAPRRWSHLPDQITAIFTDDGTQLSQLAKQRPHGFVSKLCLLNEPLGRGDQFAPATDGPGDLEAQAHIRGWAVML